MDQLAPPAILAMLSQQPPRKIRTGSKLLLLLLLLLLHHPPRPVNCSCRSEEEVEGELLLCKRSREETGSFFW